MFLIKYYTNFNHSIFTIDLKNQFIKLKKIILNKKNHEKNLTLDADAGNDHFLISAKNGL